ncbi:hypothetical protein EON63_13795 [archaeon]|nr:MAG: hypothetical protein EON63_13795 [archaeon]
MHYMPCAIYHTPYTHLFSCLSTLSCSFSCSASLSLSFSLKDILAIVLLTLSIHIHIHITIRKLQKMHIYTLINPLIYTHHSQCYEYTYITNTPSYRASFFWYLPSISSVIFSATCPVETLIIVYQKIENT